MNPDLSRLQAYPFERLHQLLKGCLPPSQLAPIVLSIGEPKHTTPNLIKEALIQHLNSLAQYPTTRGIAPLRETIAGWLIRRYQLPPNLLDPGTHILPVNGTREALFAIVQCLIDRQQPALVMMPNPFYQIYEGAALLAGATPYFMNTTQDTGFTPDFDLDAQHWEHCQLLFICSPGNPTGTVLDLKQLQKLIELAHRHDFIIASDECYSELYRDEANPPPGLLQACVASGNNNFSRCLVFHSLSKRSNAPGLRSGFVAGDAVLIDKFHLYRTYHGCAMPLPTQHASIAAWQDKAHVIENRALYRRKYREVLAILKGKINLEHPAGGFYLWMPTPIDDTEFTRRLYLTQNVKVLPGSFLSREYLGLNPGQRHVRIALVAELEECREAALRIAASLDLFPL